MSLKSEQGRFAYFRTTTSLRGFAILVLVKMKGVILCDQKLGSPESKTGKKGKALSVISSPVAPPPSKQRYHASVSAKKRFLCQKGEESLQKLSLVQYKYYSTSYGTHHCYFKVHPRCGRTGK